MAQKSKSLSPFAKSLLNNVRKHCKRTGILEMKDVHTVLACSGGVDSVAMMIIAKLLRFNVNDVVYVNHKMRHATECQKDVEVVKAATATLFPLAIVHERFTKSTPKNETDARELRYAQLYEFYQNCGLSYMTVMTGHHLDDQIETFLMRALKGAKLKALMGACPKRSLGWPNLILLRPLLTVSKNDLIELVKEFGLEWHEDVTNEDSLIERNFIRNELLPSILKKFPAAKNGLIETMIKLSEGINEEE